MREEHYKAWVESVKVDRRDLDALILFAKECKLSGYRVKFRGPPLNPRGDVCFYVHAPHTRTVAVFETRRRHRINAEYNWVNSKRPWVLSCIPRRGARRSYARIDSLLDAVERLLKDG